MLRKAAVQGRIQWHQQALECFLERGISRAEVVGAIMNDEVIEIYAAPQPYLCCLMLYVETEPLPVVAAADLAARICHVVTAYQPDIEHFEPDFTIGRKQS
jgi:hypothetical protein